MEIYEEQIKKMLYIYDASYRHMSLLKINEIFYANKCKDEKTDSEKLDKVKLMNA